MKKIIRKHYKIVIGIIIGIVLSTTIVYGAETILTGSDVTYANQSSSSADNVQNAIDDLYKKIIEQKNRMPKPNNENIISVYHYNQEKDSKDFCVTGDEETCKVNTCYLNKTKDSCPPGTIIEYKVNNTEEVRFHVIKDEGEKMTLQSQKNTIYNTAWYSPSNDNSHGPTTILNALEEKTKDWNNVNEFTYSIGEETSTLGYSSCNYDLICNSSSYSLKKENEKVRMITVQEAISFGCDRTMKNCPIWMYNYLNSSIQRGGTVNDNHVENSGTSNIGYWTMASRNEKDHLSVAYGIVSYTDNSYFVTFYTTDITFGARAVIQINK